MIIYLIFGITLITSMVFQFQNNAQMAIISLDILLLEIFGYLLYEKFKEMRFGDGVQEE